MTDPFDLQRFVTAREPVFGTVHARVFAQPRWIEYTTAEQNTDLSDMVAATIREWVKKHSLKLTGELLGEAEKRST